MRATRAVVLAIATLVGACGDGSIDAPYALDTADSVTGDGSDVPTLDLTTATFPETVVGATSTTTVTVTNTHRRKALTITALLTEPPFYVEPLAASLRLQPRQSTTIVVTVKPTSVGTFSGQLVCRIAYQTSQVFPLAATAVAAPADPPPGSAQPDVIVTAVTASPASPVSGQAVTFSAAVKNQGAGPTPQGTTLGVLFTVDGGVVAWSDTHSASLAAGASVTLTADGGPAGSATWSAASGGHTVVANVDDVNRFPESNEANNTLSTTLAVGTASVPVDGQCGSVNGTTTSMAPTTNLCAAGAPSAVTGTGPWQWTCAGSNGGTAASCSASLATAVTCSTGTIGTPPNCFPAPPAPLASGKHWAVTYSEEFNGTTLDTTKLTPCFDWNYGDCTNSFNQGKERYLPSQVRVNNGTAKLVAEPLSPSYSSSGCYNGQCTYKAGLVSTARPLANNGSNYLFPFTYGYVESKMKFPGTAGFFTAFWMLPTDPTYSYNTEIDIVEILGGFPDSIFMTYHYNGRSQSYTPNNGLHNNGACSVGNYSGKWVTFGLDWQPTHIAWYIDGVKCGQFNGNSSTIESGPMQLILHMMVDNNWERDWGSVLSSQSLTETLEVDYIRIYQQQ